MRPIRITMLLTVVMLASMSIAISKASPGSHSPPSSVITTHAELQPLCEADFQLQLQPFMAAEYVVPVIVQDELVKQNVYASLIEQKGGSNHALVYWKVNRCRLCK